MDSLVNLLLSRENNSIFLRHRNNAEVAELVDAHDSKSCSFGIVGSIPTFGTGYGMDKF